MPKKLIDLELLTRFKDKLDTELDKKANVDGNYPTLTAGLADNLTPYGEDSGAEQTNPFISNGTGTNNNTEIVTVGDYGLLKSKNGNTICVNQLAKELNNTNWTSNNANVSYSGGIATFTATAQNGNIQNISAYSLVSGRKYFVSVTIKLTTATTNVNVWLRNSHSTTNILTLDTISTSSKQVLYGIATANETGEYYRIVVRDNRDSGWDAVQVSNVALIDLTQMFNGDIPQDLLDNPNHFSWYYNGDLSYNTGSLVNANGVKLVSTGRQLWDEQWEQGAIDETSGQNVLSNAEIRSVGYIEVIPNKDLFEFVGKANTRLMIFFYDSNKNYLNRIRPAVNNSYTVPENAKYMRFCTRDSYGTTYNHDITISLYYTQEQGGEGYNKYYAYEEPYVVDTGSEVLRSAGSAKDYKEPNGTFHRLVGSYTFTGNESWSQYGSSRWQCAMISTLIKKPTNDNTKVNILFPNLIASAISNQSNYSISCDTYGNLTFFDTTNITDQTSARAFTQGKTIYYELATQTTEQGTPFAENLPINDYGMLYWLDSINNLVGVPQGNTIFFPTNYKGFVDDMYSRVDGDSSKFVIDTDLADYVKQVDVTSLITNFNTNISLTFFKVYKTGNVITISANLLNSGNNAITALTALMALPSGLYSSSTQFTFFARGAGTDGLVSISTSGELSFNTALQPNDRVFINIAYAVA